MDLGIAGKRALVCASSKGLGKAVASALVQEGVEVFLCARTEEELRAVAQELQHRSKLPVHYQVCDMADSASRQALIDRVQALWDGVDILIHNAGGPKPTSVQETSPEAWQSGFDTNFLSAVHLNQAFLPGMKSRQWGRIIALTSLTPMEPVANLAISNGIRSALTSMLKTLSSEVAADGICVNCVAPGLVQTERLDALGRAEAERTGKSPGDILKERLSDIPAARLGIPEEFAAVVTFLCSQQASYVTGSTIAVDGGKRRSTF